MGVNCQFILNHFFDLHILFTEEGLKRQGKVKARRTLARGIRQSLEDKRSWSGCGHLFVWGDSSLCRKVSRKCDIVLPENEHTYPITVVNW